MYWIVLERTNVYWDVLREGWAVPTAIRTLGWLLPVLGSTRRGSEGNIF